MSVVTNLLMQKDFLCKSSDKILMKGFKISQHLH